MMAVAIRMAVATLEKDLRIQIQIRRIQHLSSGLSSHKTKSLTNRRQHKTKPSTDRKHHNKRPTARSHQHKKKQSTYRPQQQAISTYEQQALSTDRRQQQQQPPQSTDRPQQQAIAIST